MTLDLTHPLDSGDHQRMIDYFTGRHDEREYAQSPAYLRGRHDEAEVMADWQRRAVGVAQQVAADISRRGIDPPDWRVKMRADMEAAARRIAEERQGSRDQPEGRIHRLRDSA